MKVVNIHRRIINQPKDKVSYVFRTLATPDDLIWPYENWPAIRFKDGLMLGSKGGHGLVRYTIIDVKDGEYIKFQFTKPDGFNGTHEFKMNSISAVKTEIIHEIRMKTSLKASFFWIFIIRWLHDALIEEAFDKVENYFLNQKTTANYNLWVKLLREVYKRKSFKTKQV